MQNGFELEKMNLIALNCAETFDLCVFDAMSSQWLPSNKHLYFIFYIFLFSVYSAERNIDKKSKYTQLLFLCAFWFSVFFFLFINVFGIVSKLLAFKLFVNFIK